MLAPRGARAATHAASAASTLPSFLVPAWQQSTMTTTTNPRPALTASTASSSSTSRLLQSPRGSAASFSTTSKRPSKLGRTPISIPPGVELLMGEPQVARSATSYQPTVKKTLTIKGPLGKLKLDVPEFMALEQDLENKTALLQIQDINAPRQLEMWGTTWSYLRNHVAGVSEGHAAILRLVGVGYRATVERRGAKEQYKNQPFLCLKLGFTHPVEEGVPYGVKVTVAQPTRILLEGPNYEDIMSFAGRVRQWRKPEPYKGKGVFINDETIKLKTKKIK